MNHFIPSIGQMSLTTNGVTLFEQILALLSLKMDKPTLYGWYHLLCLALTVGLCALIILRAKMLTDKQLDFTLGAFGITLLVLEIYKQLIFSYNPATDVWSFQWYAFPFQFCATPMYLLPIVAVVKNEKVRDAIYSFLATYALFAGTAVMFYPSDVFISEIGINIQTMVHHGGMVALGVLMYTTGKAKFSHKTILKGLPVFTIFVTLALIMNVAFKYYGDPNQTFNMFFISPYYPCTLPVLSMFFGVVPYPVFLLIYLFGFTLAGYVMLLIAMGSHKLYTIVCEKMLPKKETSDTADDLI